MPSLENLDARVSKLEQIINNAVALPKVSMEYSDEEVKVGTYVFGKDNSSIFGGDSFFGPCINAPVTKSSDMDEDKTLVW